MYYLKHPFLLLWASLWLFGCSSQNDPQNHSAASISSSSSPKAVSQSRLADSPLFKSDSRVHYGIDISQWQGNIIDDIQPGDSLRFILRRAAYGANFEDPDFANNWKEIKEKGFIRGAYFFYLTNESPLDQAQFFCKLMSGLEDTDIAPVLDIEQGSIKGGPISPEKLQGEILTFLNEVEKCTGRVPNIYTGSSFGQQYLNNAKFSRYGLWIADYTSAAQPQVPSTWKDKGYLIWQRSDNHRIDHIKTDFDVHYGSLLDLVK